MKGGFFDFLTSESNTEKKPEENQHEVNPLSSQLSSTGESQSDTPKNNAHVEDKSSKSFFSWFNGGKSKKIKKRKANKTKKSKK